MLLDLEVALLALVALAALVLLGEGGVGERIGGRGGRGDLREVDWRARGVDVGGLRGGGLAAEALLAERLAVVGELGGGERFVDEGEGLVAGYGGGICAVGSAWSRACAVGEYETHCSRGCRSRRRRPGSRRSRPG